MPKFYVYILRCSDNSLYTGYTTDVSQRVYDHNNSDHGAKYTRARRPVKLAYKEGFDSKSEAMKREHEIKQMDKAEKESLVK